MKKTMLVLLPATSACSYRDELIDKGAWRHVAYAERRCNELGVSTDTDGYQQCVHDKARRRYALSTCTMQPGWCDMDPDFCATAE
jgi:hypothetical protein